MGKIIKDNIIVENAKLIFKNFSGAEGALNPAGRRNFCVLLDEQTGVGLEEEGWNIKWLKPKEDGDPSLPYIQVKVSFGNIQPDIFLVSKRGKTRLTEKTVNMLDWAELKLVDLTITPYNWTVAGKQGVSAYCKSLYATIVEDALFEKYMDVPDSAVTSLTSNVESY